MKIQTSDLSGEALNYAAFCALFSPMVPNIVIRPSPGKFPDLVYLEYQTVMGTEMFSPRYDWRLGGTLLDEHLTAFHRDPDGTCWATVGMSQCSGSDILEAFLRALVTERSGKEVDVPDELVREDKE